MNTAEIYARDFASRTFAPISIDDPLVVEIKQEVARADKRVRETVASFRKLGELLIELKKRVPHGSFMAEVEKLTGIPHRSATRYMAMVYEKPSRKRLQDAPAETYLRKCLDVTIPVGFSENGQVANLPSPPARPSPTITIEAELVEPELIETEPLVVDGTKTGPNTPSCWTMAQDFISMLKPLPAWNERQALCDVIHYCKERLAELDKLNGKEKP